MGIDAESDGIDGFGIEGDGRENLTREEGDKFYSRFGPAKAEVVPE